MKHLMIFLIIYLIDFQSFSQIFLPSFHAVHNVKKIPINGLVAYFDFSLGELGYTLSGATTTSDKNGKANSAIELDDAGDKITGQFSVLLNSDFTIILWAKLNDSYPSRKMWLISFGLPVTNKAFHLGCRYDGANNGRFRVGSWNANHNTNDDLGNDFNWKYYVVTYDKSEKEYKFYINNNLTHTQTNHTLIIDAKDFIIGSQLGYNNETWYGKIDEFGSWSRILTLQEITELYNNY